MSEERVPGFADSVNTQEDYDALNINVRVWDVNGKLVKAYDNEGKPYTLDDQGNVLVDGKYYPVDSEGDIILGVSTGENYKPQ